MNKLILFTLLFLCSCGPRLSNTPKGDTGARGEAGLPCTIAAITGGAVITCPDGSQETILDGAKGSQGEAGATGASGTNGTNGTNGSDGANGTNGSDGAPGADGANGVNGTNGADANPVTTVQFCPGPTTYPSSFPEQALCLQNELYAVMWMGGQAWLSKVVPGHYATTSTGPVCSFTVSANCQVTVDP